MLDMLVTDLNKLCDELPFHTGWYLKHLRTGETAHRHGHTVGSARHTARSVSHIPKFVVQVFKLAWHAGRPPALLATATPAASIAPTIPPTMIIHHAFLACICSSSSLSPQSFSSLSRVCHNPTVVKCDYLAGYPGTAFLDDYDI